MGSHSENGMMTSVINWWILLWIGQNGRLYKKKLAHLTRLLNKHAQVEAIQTQIDEMAQQIGITQDLDMIALFKEEQGSLAIELETAQHTLNEMIAPTDEMDERSVFLEIRAGAGGQESALFASDLLKMYTNYALKTTGAYPSKVKV